MAESSVCEIPVGTAAVANGSRAESSLGYEILARTTLRLLLWQFLVVQSQDMFPQYASPFQI